MPYKWIFNICWSLPSVTCEIFACTYKRYFRLHQQNQYSWSRRDNAVKSALNFVSQMLIAKKVIIWFLCLILTLNNFVFSGIHNLQKTGSAMGTICSPTCINIFMRKFEKTHLSIHTPIFKLLPQIFPW